ncbi:hypothetical protein MK292_10190, partial [Myxococcota bacterium]|nr:hypothetical protein [Myxococcota bacterium]
MKVGYMPDTHGGPYDQPAPSADASAAFCEQILEEGIACQTGTGDIELLAHYGMFIAPAFVATNTEAAQGYPQLRTTTH